MYKLKQEKKPRKKEIRNRTRSEKLDTNEYEWQYRNNIANWYGVGARTIISTVDAPTRIEMRTAIQNNSLNNNEI